MSLQPELRPEDYDPFGDEDDVKPRPLTQAEEDKCADQRAARDRARRRKGPKQSDLESKTRNLMRELGYIYGRTEHTGWSGNKKDLFGFVDGIAVGGQSVLFVQTCSRSSKAPHIRKMATGTFKLGNGTPTDCRPAAEAIIAAPGARLVLVLWQQPGGPGTRWENEFVDVTTEMLDEAVARSRKRRAS